MQWTALGHAVRAVDGSGACSTCSGACSGACSGHLWSMQWAAGSVPDSMTALENMRFEAGETRCWQTLHAPADCCSSTTEIVQDDTIHSEQSADSASRERHRDQRKAPQRPAEEHQETQRKAKASRAPQRGSRRNVTIEQQREKANLSKQSDLTRVATE